MLICNEATVISATTFYRRSAFSVRVGDFVDKTTLLPIFAYYKILFCSTLDTEGTLFLTIKVTKTNISLDSGHNYSVRGH